MDFFSYYRVFLVLAHDLALLVLLWSSAAEDRDNQTLAGSKGQKDILGSFFVFFRVGWGFPLGDKGR